MAFRLANWDTYLIRWAQEQVGKPFVWGDTDCGSLLADAVTVMYGHGHPILNHRYTTKKDALRLARSVEGDISLILRPYAAPIAPTYAQTGDVVVDRSPFPPPDLEPAIRIWVGGLLYSSPVEGVGIDQNITHATLENFESVWRFN